MIAIFIFFNADFHVNPFFKGTKQQLNSSKWKYCGLLQPDK